MAPPGLTIGRFLRRRRAGHLLHRILLRSGWVHVERVFRLTTTDRREPAPAGPDLRCARLDEATLRREARVTGAGLEPAEVEAALARGDWCVGVFERDRLVSQCWFTSRPARLCPGLRVYFDPSWAYAYWAFTRPEQRGRALHSLGKSHALDLVVDRGLRGILSAVRADNAASLRSAARLGCRRVGSLLAFGPARRRWTAATPGCRRYGMRLEVA